MYQGQLMYMFRTRYGVDVDLVLCEDRNPESGSEFLHVINQPGGVMHVQEDTPAGPQWLKFTANENDSGIGFIVFKGKLEVPEDYVKPSFEYSLDGGKTWEDYDLQISDDLSGATLITPDAGESVLFRGVNDNLAYYLESDNAYLYVQCYMEGVFSAEGDITSLLNGVGGDVPLADNCYSYMFSGCTDLTTAPTLPATTLATNCYSYMFSGCTGLTTAPTLPANMLAAKCYYAMFSGCTDLTTAPTLPATTLASGCYSYMFSGCTGLTTAPTLPATTLADLCYHSMFSDCTGLTSAPALPATTLASGCYSYMFSGCTGLTTAPALLATTLADFCYHSMFSDCTGITSHHVATLNISDNVFDNNSSCDTLTIDAATPPTIGSNTITGLKATCVIYVPAESVDTYKAAQYWSERSSYIQAAGS